MFYEITLQVTAVLTVVVLVAAALVIVMRVVADRRRAHAERVRGLMVAAIGAYRSGASPLAEVERALRPHPAIALEALVQASANLPRPERETLLPLYVPFTFCIQEIEALRHRRWPRRLKAAARLGAMGDRDAIPALMGALGDELLDVRLAAAHALAQLEEPEAVEPILRSLALPGELPSRLAADALLDMGDAAIAPLVAFLQRGHDDAALACVAVAVQVLGERKAAAAVPALVGILAHPNAELRLNAARALGQIGDAHALEALCTMAHDPIWGVRSAAAQALGRIGDARALSTLAGRLIDRAWWVRYNAAQALYKLGAPGRDTLLETVARAADRYARDISLQVLQQNEHPAAATGVRA